MENLSLQLHQDSTLTYTEQLYQYFKKEISCGNLGWKYKIPSKRKLADTLACSVHTVERAYNQLVDEGYLISKEKSGYYVAKLEGIVHLSPQEAISSERPVCKKDYRYHFSYQGIDQQSFPISVWKKLTKESIEASDTDFFHMGNPKGEESLRMSIAQYLRYSRGVNCTEQQIIISSGTEFLLQLLILLFDTSSLYGIENPGYEKFSSLFKSNRAQFVSIPLDEYGIDPLFIEKSQANIICIAPSHQFPTGIIMPIGRRLQLLNWACEQSNRFIIEDDYDSEFRYLGKPIPSLQGLDKHNRVIYVGAFSKSLSPALRISYMVLPETLLKTYEEKMPFYICPVPTIEQKTVQKFIERGHFERHLNRMRNLYKQKREVLLSSIEKYLPYVEVLGAPAGLHCIIRVQNGMEERQLVELAQKKQVKVYGLSTYYSDPNYHREKNILLLGFASFLIEELPKAVSLLNEAWS